MDEDEFDFIPPEDDDFDMVGAMYENMLKAPVNEQESEYDGSHLSDYDIRPPEAAEWLSDVFDESDDENDED